MNSSTRAERELRAAEERLTAARGERDRHLAAADAAEREKASVADDPRAFAAAEEAARQHRLEAERLEIVAARREEELAAARSRLELARYEHALAALSDACARQRALSERLAKAVAAAVSAAAPLLEAREEVSAATAQARELCPDGVVFELPPNADEVAFPSGVAGLVKLLEAGPVQPIASITQALAEQERQQRVSENAVVREAVWRVLHDGDTRFLETLDGELLERAAERVDALAASIPATTERVREALARRVERVKAIAADRLHTAAVERAEA